MRRAVTLIELLIVMTILLMITAAAIPLMLPAIQNRRGREAARLVSSFISGARSRAIETGRPVGVMLERYNGLSFAFQLSYVEVPLPYGGDSLTSTFVVALDGTGPKFMTDTAWQGGVQIRSGDRIQFNYQGPRYRINVAGAALGEALTTANQTQWFLSQTDGSLPVFVKSAPEPFQDTNKNGAYDLGEPFTDLNGDSAWNPFSPRQFQIFRQPARSASTPLQLPDNAVVDLENSGLGISGQFAAGFNPIFTFAPGGGLDYVELGAGLIRPTGPIYLLVGRRDQMPDAAPNGRQPTPTSPLVLNNLTDPESLWITIGYQTGLVASAENSLAGNAFPGTPSAARFFAQHAQSMGGR